jgi:hypothetical protein
MELKSYQKDSNTWKTLGCVPNRSVTPVAGVWDSRLLARTYLSLGVPVIEAMAICAIKFMPAIWSQVEVSQSGTEFAGCFSPLGSYTAAW